MIVLNWLAIFFRKLELDLVGEQKFDEEVHDLMILFAFEVIIKEHFQTSRDEDFSAALVLVDGRNWPVTWIGQGS